MLRSQEASSRCPVPSQKQHTVSSRTAENFRELPNNVQRLLHTEVHATLRLELENDSDTTYHNSAVSPAAAKASTNRNALPPGG